MRNIVDATVNTHQIRSLTVVALQWKKTSPSYLLGGEGFLHIADAGGDSMAQETSKGSIAPTRGGCTNSFA
jgi:hypothetical protein